MIIIYSYTIIVTVMETPTQMDYQTHIRGDYEITYLSKRISMNWFSGFATLILSFYCHPSFFYVKRELFLPSNVRVEKVLKYSICAEMAIYFMMGCFGYVSLGDNGIVDLFVLRPPATSTDYCMDVAFF